MEEEYEVLSSSDPSDSSEEYTVDPDDEEEEEGRREQELEDGNNGYEPSSGRSAPSDADLKSKNVDALLRYQLMFSLIKHLSTYMQLVLL